MKAVMRFLRVFAIILKNWLRIWPAYIAAFIFVAGIVGALLLWIELLQTIAVTHGSQMAFLTFIASMLLVVSFIDAGVRTIRNYGKHQGGNDDA